MLGDGFAPQAWVKVLRWLSKRQALSFAVGPRHKAEWESTLEVIEKNPAAHILLYLYRNVLIIHLPGNFYFVGTLVVWFVRSAVLALAVDIATVLCNCVFCAPETMTVNAPWSTLRPNPRDQRERAAADANYGVGDGQLSTKDGEPEIHWDVTDFGKRMAFGCIVSTILLYFCDCTFSAPRSFITPLAVAAGDTTRCSSWGYNLVRSCSSRAHLCYKLDYKQQHT